MDGLSKYRMKLWHISQIANLRYDVFDSAVVAAETADAARLTHPSDDCQYDYLWVADRSLVRVRLIGEAIEGTQAGVICASFNAG